MPRGGAREGAGRKPGTPNRATAERQREIAATGETPLEYLIRVMRDTTADYERRDKAASAAAPYVHAKLASVEYAGKDGSPIAIELNDTLGLARTILPLLWQASPELVRAIRVAMESQIEERK